MIVNTKTNTMTVKELITELSKYNSDKVVVLTDPDGIGWTNIGIVVEDKSTIKITEDDYLPFD